MCVATMNILDLSSELLHEILLHAVHSRGVARAARLSLVCKRFRKQLPKALFESRLLDDHYTGGLYNGLLITELWPIRKDYGGLQFWHDYYVYRVRNEQEQNGTDPRTGRYVEIREIAEEFNRQTQVDLGHIIDALCWLAMERWKYPYRSTDKEYVTPNLGLNLLSAATSFDNISLAKRLLSEGHIPTDDNDLFPSPMEIAALTGNANMLKIFQESLPEFEELVPRYSYDTRTWRGKTGPGSIRGAALRGDLEILRLAIYPPSRAKLNDEYAGKPVGEVVHETPQGADLKDSLHCCKNSEIFEYLCSFFEKSSLLEFIDMESLVARYAAMGNVEMVRHLLDAGVKMQGVNNCNPLHLAAHYGHENIVDLLIERGIDLGDSDGQARGTPLMAAASSGCMRMVRKLVDAGARIAEDEELGYAVQLEHTEMANYFMDLYSPHPENWSRHLVLAEEEGLESMAQLLRDRGVIIPEESE
ncbi:ankyrin [Periconia macrospinosa]|uniref:Ankyrin n=1 Tax=Periconia macrospinosa TaxID=97972 RepID=A0A2V1DUD2_9PLEO|nr:ankyrin [Periconia macrospinosa]